MIQVVICISIAYSTISHTPSDITYIWTNEGWLYLAGVKDLYSKEIVGYALNKRMTADLVCEALNNAIKYKRPAYGLIVHSDRGSQYCSHQYRQTIEKRGYPGSISRKGNCYDNAPIESFWGKLKNELVYHKVYETRQQAIADVTSYIEIFYNRQRIQKGLGFKSPAGVSKTFTVRLPDIIYQVFFSVVDSRGHLWVRSLCLAMNKW